MTTSHRRTGTTPPHPTVTCPRYARGVAAASGVPTAVAAELAVELDLHDGTCQVCGTRTVVAEISSQPGPSLCVRCGHAFTASTSTTAMT